MDYGFQFDLIGVDSIQMSFASCNRKKLLKFKIYVKNVVITMNMSDKMHNKLVDNNPDYQFT